MSEFFNKKEEVLSIQLTPYGKKLLIEGNFKPEYYSFHDTDICYDSAYMEIQQSQNSIQTRIEDNTQRLKPIVNFSSVEKNSEIISPTIGVEKFKFSSILGTSLIGEQKFPAFDIKLLKGGLSGSVLYYTSSQIPHRIPQLNCEIVEKYDYLEKEFEVSEYLLLRILEENGIYEKENFEISFFEIDENNSKLKPLYYVESNLANSELLVNNISEQDIGNTELETENIEYYFKVKFDNKIQTDFEVNDFNNEQTEELRNLLMNIDNTVKLC
jgi:hypothetical protein